MRTSEIYPCELLYRTLAAALVLGLGSYVKNVNGRVSPLFKAESAPDVSHFVNITLQRMVLPRSTLRCIAVA